MPIPWIPLRVEVPKFPTSTTYKIAIFRLQSFQSFTLIFRAAIRIGQTKCNNQKVQQANKKTPMYEEVKKSFQSHIVIPDCPVLNPLLSPIVNFTKPCIQKTLMTRHNYGSLKRVLTMCF